MYTPTGNAVMPSTGEILAPTVPSFSILDILVTSADSSKEVAMPNAYRFIYGTYLSMTHVSVNCYICRQQGHLTKFSVFQITIS
jgi:hypothetical protein